MKSLFRARNVLGVTLCFWWPHCSTVRAQQAVGSNIALGKKVTLAPKPNSAEPGNRPESLTDGNPPVAAVTQEGTSALWVQPGAVGWNLVSPAVIVVDLESVQPISGFSYHTAAGTSDVTLPTAIHVAVSDDQKAWRYAGDLVKLSDAMKKAPQYGTYQRHTYVTHDVKVRGRYVAFGVASKIYVTTDEVEVFAGTSNAPDQSVKLQSSAASVLEYMRSFTVKQGQSNRIKHDSALIATEIARSSIPQASKNLLAARVKAAQKLDGIQPLPGLDYKAIIPVNGAHRELLAIRGQLMAMQGFRPLTVWSQQRYSWLPLLATPPKNAKAAIHFAMLGNQFRAQSLLLTNASAAEKVVTLKLDGAPKGARSGWLKVDAAEWTDTQRGIVISDALLPAESQNGAYRVTVPAGTTRKVWLTVDSSKLTAGRFKSSLQVQSGGTQSKVPFNLDVSRVNMNRPRISLGMWDESDSAEAGQAMGITALNKAAALKLMKSHYVDTAWGKRTTLPWPEAKDFDANNKLVTALNFDKLDKWIGEWPDARHFFNFVYADRFFAGAEIGTPEFDARLGNWAVELSRHLKQIGIKPKQFGFMVIDEQRTDEHDAIVKAWANVLKKVTPEISIFQNPNWVRPDLRKDQQALVQADVLSPMMPLYYRGGAPAKAWYENLRKQGKLLWFYQCFGPARLFDPQRYYRYQAWHTYSIGGTGQGFWSFGDIGRQSNTSWNDYSNAPFFSFTPQFIDVDTMQTSVHWESVREGMQDYEELAMLRDSIAQCKNSAWRARAQQVHDNAVKAVTGIWRDGDENDRFTVLPHYDWRSTGYDDNLADRHLKNVRAMLLKLSS